MSLHDSRTGYGWVSIALHWLGAILVLTLWFVGSSIATAGSRSVATLHLHTSLAISFYLLLWLRVGWRWKRGHPPPLPAQRGLWFSIGRTLHLALLIVIAAMLLTGPFTVWLRGDAIGVFALAIPSPFTAHAQAAQLLQRCHSFGANLILIGTLLHIGGALKHVAFNRDGTLERILIAAKREK